MTTPQFIDTHCHIDAQAFDDDRQACITRARDAGVSPLVVVGASQTHISAQRAVDLADKYDDIFATVGIHPHDTATIADAGWPTIERLADHPKVVAIGETGLDYFYDHATPDDQKQAFVRSTDIAENVGKPLICHIRDAHDDAIEFLDSRAPKIPVVIHCFTGTVADAERYAARGDYVSFSGIATFRNAAEIRAAMAIIPHERLLLETDCPYLAPMPHRGKRNEPAFLVHTAAVLAKETGLSMPALADATTSNARRLFALTHRP